MGAGAGLTPGWRDAIKFTVLVNISIKMSANTLSTECFNRAGKARTALNVRLPTRISPLLQGAPPASIGDPVW